MSVLVKSRTSSGIWDCWPRSWERGTSAEPRLDAPPKLIDVLSTGGDVHAKGVSQDEVRVSLTKLSGRVLWFLDTCHAGSAGKRGPMRCPIRAE